MNLRRMLCLLLALCMCLSLAACGKSGGEASDAPVKAEAEEHPEFVYTAEYKTLVEGTKNYLSVRGYTGDGFYVSSMEKTGENIPEGVTPRYEGEFDVYGTFLYHMDFDGNMTKLQSYATLPPEVDEQGRREFTSSSNLSGIGFTDEGFVTIEMVYSSWNAGDGSAELYSEQYWQDQKYEQKYYIRSFI